MKFYKKLLLTLLFNIYLISSVFGAEHHTSWNGDINTSFEIVNNDEPYFTENERKSTKVWELYSDLDELGRCGVAYANLCKKLQPKKGEKRKSISHVYPSGWKYKNKSNNHQYKDIIKGNGYVYNRSHLIAFALAGENDNNLNLITGTDWFNHEGMLYEAENNVIAYLKRYPNNHVLYRVTPIYEGDNLVAEGVRIEAYSVEDQGEGICFNKFFYNIQPEIEINYKTGENWIQQINSEIIETLPNIEENIQNYEDIIATQDITQTLDLYKEPELSANETTIQQDIEEGMYVFKIILPIIIATCILIFVVLFASKILEKPKKQ